MYDVITQDSTGILDQFTNNYTSIGGVFFHYRKYIKMTFRHCLLVWLVAGLHDLKHILNLIWYNFHSNKACLLHILKIIFYQCFICMDCMLYILKGSLIMLILKYGIPMVCNKYTQTLFECKIWIQVNRKHETWWDYNNIIVRKYILRGCMSFNMC